MGVRDTVQELRELGVSGALFRAGWELRMRTGAMKRFEAPAPPFEAARAPAWTSSLPFGDPREVAAAMRDRLVAVDRLANIARVEAQGRIWCFHHEFCDFGADVDWYLHPRSRKRWDASLHWSESLAGLADIGDPKLTWEPARFPQAARLARAAAFSPKEAPAHFAALVRQVEGFVRATPHPYGLHWFSSQECAIRLGAWAFAAHVFKGLGEPVAGFEAVVSRYAWTAAHHTERHLEYARKAVYNNHLITEALGLYLASRLVPDGDDGRRWASLGLALLDEQADRQFYRDGAYLNLAHNYHRAVLQEYLLAWRLLECDGVRERPPSWRRAMERSLDFLVAQQNPADGRLPNYGSNDGSLPRPLSTCAFGDFRPTLQTLSVAMRGERLYPPGPWDEECAWTLGAASLDAPLREPARRSVSFADTGFHVLRGSDPSTFSVLRCGTLRDRFGQIDMLHLDAWWRGENVLVDGGTYLYNGAPKWTEHFIRTASHNTVTVDGRDQMLHWRQFKFLYWTRARLVAFEDRGAWAVAAGEHDGYARHPGGCVHRRAVLLVKDSLTVVVDRVTGEGAHTARLHWLAGPYDHAYDPATATLSLATPAGRFELATFDEQAVPMPGDVARGAEDPPRGWASRHYAQRVAVPSLAVTREGACPITFVTVMGEGPLAVSRSNEVWNVRAGARNVSFRIADGTFADLKESLG